MEEVKTYKDDEVRFRYKLQKGRIAENIIQELFIEAGYFVRKFGIESVDPTLSQMLSKSRDEKTKQIRKTPDFIVADIKEDYKNNRAYYVETKFRWNGIISHNDVYKFLSDDFIWKDCLFTIVSDSEFFCISRDELKDEFKGVPGKSRQQVTRKLNIDLKKRPEYLLSNRSEFVINEMHLRFFKELSAHYFNSLFNRDRQIGECFKEFV